MKIKVSFDEIKTAMMDKATWRELVNSAREIFRPRKRFYANTTVTQISDIASLILNKQLHLGLGRSPLINIMARAIYAMRIKKRENGQDIYPIFSFQR